MLWGAWVAQLVKCPTSAQVMISQFVSLSPMWGSVLTAQSLEPASDSVSLSPSLLMLCVCLSIISINNNNNNKKESHALLSKPAKHPTAQISIENFNTFYHFLLWLILVLITLEMNALGEELFPFIYF